MNEIELRKKYRPLSMYENVNKLFNDMNQWFDDMFWRPFSLSVFDDDNFLRMPLFNISEDENSYHLTAELPGLDKKDLEINIHDGALEIKGEKKEEHENKDEKGYIRKEFSSSSYFRKFKLPENIDEEKIDATLDNGILKLDLQKKELEHKEKKKIEIK